MAQGWLAALTKGPCGERRLVRTNITQAADPSTWQVVIPEHEKDLLTSANALKVRAAWVYSALHACSIGKKAWLPWQ